MTEKQNELIKNICQWFAHNNSTLGFAESCTGGLVSSWVTGESGVSSFYQGAVVSYAGQVKSGLLDVSETTMKEFGEVSEQVALEMARGACKNLNSQWAVSITGIAGPTGGTPDKPVGTVCYSVVGPNIEKTVRMNFENKERTLLQQEAALYGLSLLWQNLPHTH